MSHESVTMSDSIRDFIFDLHDATRRSFRLEDVTALYDKFKEIADSYFASSPWPSADEVSAECGGDQVFLLFYRELIIRHHFTKLKQIPLSLYLDSWANYTEMFKVLFNESDNFMMISAQWAYDIVQEFVYQFQSFCQNRSVNSRVESDTSGARSDPWSLPIVANTLRRVIAKSTGENATPTPANIHSMMAYFCRVELARMECLLSDYSGSMDAIASINLHDPSEFFTSVPVCHVNVFYHAAVSMLMTRRYGDAIDTLSGVILHISRLLKPGSSTLKAAVLTQHQKMMDKILLLCAIAITICPEHRADGQVVEMVVAKCSDKLKRLQSGDVGAFEDAFESACPKFISPTFSDFGGGFDAWRAQVHVFMGEAKQHIALMKVRSYLRLYSCIDLEKLSRFNDVSQEELVAKLLALSHKCRSSRSDVSYYIEDGKLFTDGDAASAMASVSTRYFFVSNIQKTADHRADLNSIFRDFEAC